jgi:hypothetical protein
VTHIGVSGSLRSTLGASVVNELRVGGSGAPVEFFKRCGSGNFASSTFVNPLASFNPNPFSWANSLDSTLTLRNNGLAAGLPANFLMANPNKLGGAQVTGNGGYTNFHSAQFELRRRMANGLQFNSSYVFGRAPDVAVLLVPRPAHRSARRRQQVLLDEQDRQSRGHTARLDDGREDRPNNVPVQGSAARASHAVAVVPTLAPSRTPRLARNVRAPASTSVTASAVTRCSTARAPCPRRRRQSWISEWP